MEMDIGEETKVYSPGQYYFIPEGVTHAGRPLTDCKVLDVFFTPGRYKAQE